MTMSIGLILGGIDRINIKNAEKIIARAGAQIIVTITMFIRRELVIGRDAAGTAAIPILILRPNGLRTAGQAGLAGEGSV